MQTLSWQSCRHHHSSLSVIYVHYTLGCKNQLIQICTGTHSGSRQSPSVQSSRPNGSLNFLSESLNPLFSASVMLIERSFAAAAELPVALSGVVAPLPPRALRRSEDMRCASLGEAAPPAFTALEVIRLPKAVLDSW